MNAENNLPKWREVRFHLKFPVGDVKELVFREPDGEVLETIDELGIQEGMQPSVRHMNLIIAALARVSVDLVRKMHQSDIAAAGEACVPLISGEVDQSASNT